MHPMLMFVIALLIPVVIVAMVFLPVHLGFLAALYAQYGESALQYKYQFFNTLKLYRQLYEYWSAHGDQLDFVSFTLPTLGLPALGILVSLYGTYRIVKYIRDIFVLTID